MKILLAFFHTAPGKGEIRARVYAYGARSRTLTVGRYYHAGDDRGWIACLWAAPGKARVLADDGVITAPDVFRLSNAAAARGKWWA